MGLDIYFYKTLPTAPEGKERVYYYDLQGRRRWYKSEYKDGSCLLGYYRKVNFLIPAFGYPDDNCCDHRLHSEDFKRVAELCKVVLLNNSLAEGLLPTQGGFFFGTTEYDAGYFSKVEQVGKWAEKILSEWDDTLEYYMHCWW